MASSPQRDQPHQQGDGGEPQSIEELLYLEEFYRSMRAVLLPIAFSKKLPAGDVENVIQEVWLAAWKNRQRFHGKDAVQQLCAWMCSVMQRKIADAFRAKRRRQALSLDISAVEPAAPKEDETERKLHLWLREQVEGMAEDESLDACLMRGRLVGGQTNAELAQREGLTEKAVEDRICRKIVELRQKAEGAGLLAPRRRKAHRENKQKKVEKSVEGFWPLSD